METTKKGDFVADIEQIRLRARQDMEKGALSGNYKANREQVIKLLNASLATELICVARYKLHGFMAEGINSEPIAQEFFQHAQEEAGHADLLAERIVQLGGTPNFNPEGQTKRSHSQYVECSELVDMVKENLVAERIAVEIYSDSIRYIGDDDPTTRRILERILEKEEEHAEDMVSLLSDFKNSTESTEKIKNGK